MSKEIHFALLHPILSEGLIADSPPLQEVKGLLTFLRNCCKCKRRQTIEQVTGYISGWPTSLSLEKRLELKKILETDLLIIVHDHGTHTEKICEF